MGQEPRALESIAASAYRLESAYIEIDIDTVSGSVKEASEPKDSNGTHVTLKLKGFFPSVKEGEKLQIFPVFLHFVHGVVHAEHACFPANGRNPHPPALKRAGGFKKTGHEN